MNLKQRHNDLASINQRICVKKHALNFYNRILEIIVTVLILVMVLTLLCALVGLIMDFGTAVNSMISEVGKGNHRVGVVDSIDRELVIDVLSVFVLIELFRTFTDYLEFNRVRLRVLSEVGIVFVLRELFIGLYSQKLAWPEILALSVLLAILITARIAAVQFQPQDNRREVAWSEVENEERVKEALQKPR
jgi:uncharacterized membrane protein (DUF373 family)